MKTIKQIEVSIKEYDDIYLVTLSNTNKINILNADAIESKLAPLAWKTNTTIYLNLSEITFIDSKGFSTLLKIQRLAFINDSNLVIYNLDDEVKDLFDLLGLNSEFEISKNGPIINSRIFQRKVS